MTEDRMTVAVIGDALVDVMRDESGSVEVPGGSALNCATGLASLGVSTVLVAMVGDDVDGALLRARLEDAGVPLVAGHAPLGTGRAVSDRTGGEPRYLFTPAVKLRTIIPSPEISAAVAAAGLVLVSGFPFDRPGEVAVLDALIGERRDRVMVDANPRPDLLADVEAFGAALLAASAGVGLVKIGSEDAELLFGAELPNVAARFLAAGARAVLATHGPGGVTLHRADGDIHRPIAADSRPIVDTMGAGDATFASVAADVVRDGAPETLVGWGAVLDRAMAIAAETIRHPGGMLRQPTAV